MEIPETRRDLLKIVGEKSLSQSFRVFSIDIPDHLSTEGQFLRAGEGVAESLERSDCFAWGREYAGPGLFDRGPKPCELEL